MLLTRKILVVSGTHKLQTCVKNIYIRHGRQILKTFTLCVPLCVQTLSLEIGESKTKTFINTN